MNQFPAIAAKTAHPKPTTNAGVAVPKSRTVTCMSRNTNGTNPRKAKRLRFRLLRSSLHGSVSAIAFQCSVLVREVKRCNQAISLRTPIREILSRVENRRSSGSLPAGFSRRTFNGDFSAVSARLVCWPTKNRTIYGFDLWRVRQLNRDRIHYR